MERVRTFFNIKTKYNFEWNDLRAVVTIINVILIMIFGLSISWFGLAVALVGLVKDFTDERHINGILMHLASAILNIYFLTLLYK
ncbi:MAG: hypothetical protein LIR50_21345 [Bacillota bacterium]|nr:hypothetical protein [Bacillota bacterium]